jgi:1-aminocyclopropane-1-carboxylate deaminase
MFQANLPSPVNKFDFPNFENSDNLNFFVKRDDLIHSLVSGNKWRKLNFNLRAFRNSGKKGIVTFGGAFSNHLLATAALCNQENVEVIGIVRGEELNENSNATLQKCSELGMKLVFANRTDYKNKLTNKILKINNINFDDFFEIPEGGANLEGVLGCEEIVNEISEKYDYIACACGTATTLAGIISAASKSTKVMGISVLKGKNYHQTLIKEYENLFHLDFSDKDYQILEDYHFGAYGKINQELIDFKKLFETQNLFQLDYVYTAKMFFAIHDLAKKSFFKKNSQILLIHTGGLYGNKFYDSLSF